MNDRWRSKYEWRLTHGGRPRDDWSAYDGKLFIGRIWREISNNGERGQFRWQGARHIPRLLTDSGCESSHRKAAKAVEDYYDGNDSAKLTLFGRIGD